MSKARALNKDWFNEIATGNKDLSRVRPVPRKVLALPPDVSSIIPPFKGISRKLVSMKEACEVIGCGMTFLQKQIHTRMIFPQPRGRLVRIPIEEIENYNERERIRYQERHA